MFNIKMKSRNLQDQELNKLHFQIIFTVNTTCFLCSLFNSVEYLIFLDHSSLTESHIFKILNNFYICFYGHESMRAVVGDIATGLTDQLYLPIITPNLTKPTNHSP